MWCRPVFALLLLALVATQAAKTRDRNTKKYKVVCYLGSWANYRQGEGKFLIEDINPFICTHVIYGFAKLNPDNKIAVYDPYLDLKENWGLGAFNRFNGLKKKNPELTTLIAIGGWNEGSTKYSQMASNAGSRKVFVDSVVNFLQKYDFDGLDMDWEYPANRGGVPADKENFILLLKDLKEAFEPHGYLLTAAVSAGKSTMDTAYDIPGMARYMDFINIMAYDLHGSWEKFTGHNAPLHGRPDEEGDQRNLNVETAVDMWLKGAPPHKLVLGMALYGRSFTLANTNENGLGAPATGPGRAGPVTKEPGMLGYNEICKSLKTETGWNVVVDEHHKAPYAYKDRQWVGYDDSQSIKLKCDFLKEKNLAGGMVWSIETDDFRGICFGHKYPLLTVINEELNGPIVIVTEDPNQTDPPKPPTTTSKPVIVTDDDGTEITCKQSGMFRHPKDCERYYECEPRGGGSFTIYHRRCGPGTAFDEKNKVCTFRNQVPECNN